MEKFLGQTMLSTTIKKCYCGEEPKLNGDSYEKPELFFLECPICLDSSEVCSDINKAVQEWDKY